MSIAAVPAYLGKNFSTASPGMRFGMYLAVWRRDWEKEKNPDWQSICRMRNEQPLVRALQQRQSQQAESISETALLMLPARSTAPFVTGMGNEHPLENGFAFLWPYGIPYLPGSGVKGVLRQAARELLSREWGESLWQNAPGGEVTIDKKKKALTAMDVLFGLESKDGGKEHFRGLLTFWDVIPEIHGNKLMVDIMTPHQTHYYQNDQPPHDSGQPNPISFLTVPPGSVFPFHITCDTARLHRIAPELLQEQDGLAMWKHLIQAAFEHAFEWLGFGAKTAVGYGAMKWDTQLQAQREAERQKAKAQAKREAQIKAAVADLPEDAAWLEQQRITGVWSDTNRFLDAMEQFLAEKEIVSEAALERLHREMEARWKGIMADPDATQGRKKKPKFKPRPTKMAKKIIGLKKENT